MADVRKQIQLLKDAPFLADQRHAVKDYIQDAAPRPFACYPVAMHRLAPYAAIALLAALDALGATAVAGTCRALGRHFELGQTACLATPNGPRLATCAMVLNNSSWQFSEVPCTVSDVSPPGAPRSAFLR
jgi:hypothetical protein